MASLPGVIPKEAASSAFADPCGCVPSLRSPPGFSTLRIALLGSGSVTTFPSLWLSSPRDLDDHLSRELSALYVRSASHTPGSLGLSGLAPPPPLTALLTGGSLSPLLLVRGGGGRDSTLSVLSETTLPFFF